MRFKICFIIATMFFVAGNSFAEVPAQAEWESSGHADTTAEAFTHWDEDDPPVVSASCAKCHSTSGYRDFLGVDGSAAGSVEATVPVGEVIDCTACHNDHVSAFL